MSYSVRHTSALLRDPSPPGGPSQDAALDALADHCISARAIIAERGSPVMQRLIDLILFEIASELAGQCAGAGVGSSQDN